MKRFKATVRSSGRGGGHFVDVPERVLAALGDRGRIPVNATIGGVPYRRSIVRMGDGAVLGLLKSIMARTGDSVGEEIEVTVEADIQARQVAVPADLEHPRSRTPRPEPGAWRTLEALRNRAGR